MRAVRLTAARRLELVTVPDPEPGPGEVVLRVAACGICGSDLSCYRTGVFGGSILGHELAGIVEATGSDVDGWRPGDGAAVDPKLPCGACADCSAGAAHRCIAALTRGIGAERPGGFAERVAVPAWRLHRLPAGLHPDDACLAEPLAVAVHGVARAGVRPGDRAVVIGLGPMGLLTIAALRAAGARVAAGIEPVAARRALGARLGAEAVYDPANAREAAGAPLVVECSGAAPMVQEAANLVAPGGRVLLLGVAMTEATVVPMVWVTREISVIGSIASSDEDFGRAVSLLASEPHIASIITRRVSLAEVPRAFEELLHPVSDAKVVVDPRVGP